MLRMLADEFARLLLSSVVHAYFVAVIVKVQGEALPHNAQSHQPYVLLTQCYQTTLSYG